MRDFRLSSFLAAVLCLGVVAISSSLARAVEGAFEINQACAMTGCFDFDAPGFPVLINSGLDSPRFVLTSDLDLRGVPAGENVDAISVFGSGTTLDLNGFSIIGPGVAGSGVGVDGRGADGLSVINGRIIGMGSLGIYARDFARIVNMTVIENGDHGIIANTQAYVSGCIAWNNAGDGINVASGTIEQNTSGNNTGYGIGIFGTSVVYNNAVGFNDAGGIRANFENHVRANAVRGPSGLSLDVGLGTTSVSENVLGSAGGAGFVETGPNLCGENLTCP